ncbi:hypothetical protein LINPERPRIM_LOCUS30754 [Linum perenne]
MEPPLVDPGVSGTNSLAKVTKRACIRAGSSVESAFNEGARSPPPPSFRDKVASFWSENFHNVEVLLSDESDVDKEDYDPKCPTIKIPDGEKLSPWEIQQRDHLFQAAAEGDLRPKVDEDFRPWMQVKNNWRKAKPTSSPAAAAPMVHGSDPMSKKGNSFATLIIQESDTELAQIVNQSDLVPLKDDSIGISVGFGEANNKENQSPTFSTPLADMVVPPTDPSVVGDHFSVGGLGSKAHLCPQIVPAEESSAHSPTDSIKNKLAQSKNSGKALIWSTAPLAQASLNSSASRHLHHTTSANNGLKKGNIPLKGNKISKHITKDLSAVQSFLNKAVGPSSALKDVLIDMEEV